MPRRHRLIVAGLFVLSAIAYCPACSGQNLLHDQESLKQKVEEIVTPYLHRAAQEVAPTEDCQTKQDHHNAERPSNRAWAVVVGIVTKDGRQVFNFGRFTATSDQKPDDRTLVEIGSVTKTFTALLLADLVEQGKVKFDESLRLYLPESTTVPRRGNKEISLLHLATHTSALPRIPTAIALKSLISDNPYHGYGAEDLYKSLSSITLSRDPGEKYDYSNLAFGLLGHVLSRQAGKTYEELVTERICKPLGLSETRITLDDESRKRLAPPHDELGRRSSNWDFDAFAGAGAVRSTTADMLTYLEANMGLKQCALLPAMRRCHQARYPAASDVQSIGLGWHIQHARDDRQLLFHGGGTGGYNCIVGFVQEKEKPALGIVVFANGAPGGRGMAANDIAVKLLAAIRESED
jgi:serine-type D-Ala-D-Ala carboxypeptidase/endopeptidase